MLLGYFTHGNDRSPLIPCRSTLMNGRKYDDHSQFDSKFDSLHRNVPQIRDPTENSFTEIAKQSNRQRKKTLHPTSLVGRTKRTLGVDVRGVDVGRRVLCVLRHSCVLVHVCV